MTVNLRLIFSTHRLLQRVPFLYKFEATLKHTYTFTHTHSQILKHCILKCVCFRKIGYIVLYIFLYLMNFLNNKHFFVNHKTKVLVLEKRVFTFCFASRIKLNHAETALCRFFFKNRAISQNHLIKFFLNSTYLTCIRNGMYEPLFFFYLVALLYIGKL